MQYDRGPDAAKWPPARCLFEEKHHVCYTNDSMVECYWLIVGHAEHCGKPCVNRLCGLHRGRLRRKPGSEPQPCRRCGKGTKAETQLCSKECGADRGQEALHRVEVRAKRIYPTVMHELLRTAEHQRTLPFIGLCEAPNTDRALPWPDVRKSPSGRLEYTAMVRPYIMLQGSKRSSSEQSLSAISQARPLQFREVSGVAQINKAHVSHRPCLGKEPPVPPSPRGLHIRGWRLGRDQRSHTRWAQGCLGPRRR